MGHDGEGSADWDAMVRKTLQEMLDMLHAWREEDRVNRLKWEEESRKWKQSWVERESTRKEGMLKTEEIENVKKEILPREYEKEVEKVHHNEDEQEVVVLQSPSAMVSAEDGGKWPLLEKDFRSVYERRRRKKVSQGFALPQPEEVSKDEKPVENALFKDPEIAADKAPRGNEIESRRKEQTAMKELSSQPPSNAGQGGAISLLAVLKSGLGAGRNWKMTGMVATSYREDDRENPEIGGGPATEFGNIFVCHVSSKILGLLVFGLGPELAGPDITQVDHGPSFCLGFYSGPAGFLPNYGQYSKPPQITPQNQFPSPTLLFQFMDGYAGGAFSEEIVVLPLQQPWKLQKLSRQLSRVFMVKLHIVVMAFWFAWWIPWAETELGEGQRGYLGQLKCCKQKESPGGLAQSSQTFSSRRIVISAIPRKKFPASLGRPRSEVSLLRCSVSDWYQVGLGKWQEASIKLVPFPWEDCLVSDHGDQLYIDPGWENWPYPLLSGFLLSMRRGKDWSWRFRISGYGNSAKYSMEFTQGKFNIEEGQMSIYVCDRTGLDLFSCFQGRKPLGYWRKKPPWHQSSS